MGIGVDSAEKYGRYAKYLEPGSASESGGQSRADGSVGARPSSSSGVEEEQYGRYAKYLNPAPAPKEQPGIVSRAASAVAAALPSRQDLADARNSAGNLAADVVHKGMELVGAAKPQSPVATPSVLDSHPQQAPVTTAPIDAGAGPVDAKLFAQVQQGVKDGSIDPNDPRLGGQVRRIAQASARQAGVVGPMHDALGADDRVQRIQEHAPLDTSAPNPDRMESDEAKSWLGQVLDRTNRKPLDNSLAGAALETVGDAARGTVRGVNSVAGGMWGGVQAASDVLLGPNSKLSGVARESADAVDRANEDLASPDRNSLTQQIFESTFQNVPILLGFGAGSKALGAMGALSGAQSYHEARAAGKPVDQAIERGVWQGIAEVIGERVSVPTLGKLFSKAAAGVSNQELGHVLADLLVKEQLGEQVTTALQDTYDKFGAGGMRKDMTVGDYLNDVVNTAKVTLGQSLLMGGGAHIVKAAATGAPEQAPQPNAFEIAKSKGFLVNTPLTTDAPTARRSKLEGMFRDLSAHYGMTKAAEDAAIAAARGKSMDEAGPYLRRVVDAYQRKGLIGGQVDAQIADVLTAPPVQPPEKGEAKQVAGQAQAPAQRPADAEAQPAQVEPDFTGLSEGAAPTNDAIDAASLVSDSGDTKQSKSIPNAVMAGSDAPSNFSKGVPLSEQGNGEVNVPRDFTKRHGLDAPTLEGLKQIRVGGSNSGSGILGSKAAVDEGYRALDVPTQARVFKSVLSLIHDDKIFRSVVHSIPVEVMDQLTGKQFSPEQAFNDSAVLIHALSTNRNLPVVGRAIDALVRSPAFPVAEGGSENLRGWFKDQSSAEFALEGNGHESATSQFNDTPLPTVDQQRVGNYKKGHITFQGLDVSIENPPNSIRSGIGSNGMPWATRMQHAYGYIKGTVGNDKDHVDTFIGQNPESGKAFVIDQIDPKTGRFDEHKVVLGADSIEQAREIYQSNYAADWRGLGAITELPMPAFKSWVKDGAKKAPLGDIEAQRSEPTDEELRDQLAHVSTGQLLRFANTDRFGEDVRRVAAAEVKRREVEHTYRQQEQQRAAEEDRIVQDSRDALATQAEATGRAGDLEGQGAMQAAMAKAQQAAKQPAKEAAPLQFERKPDGTVLVKGDPARIKAEFPGMRGIVGKRGVTYGVSRADEVIRHLTNAPAPVKAERNPGKELDAEGDTMLTALAKLGGINRNVMAKEFGLRPEELKFTVRRGRLVAYPFRANGGMGLDAALTALQEAGYFEGSEDARTDFEHAVYAELGGQPVYTAQGELRRGMQAHAEDAARARAQAQEDRVLADQEASAEADAERDAIIKEHLSDEEVQALTDEDLLDAWDASNATTEHAMRALGFTEEEIAHAVEQEAGPAQERTGEGGQVATQGPQEADRSPGGQEGVGAADEAGQGLNEQGQQRQAPGAQDQTAADQPGAAAAESGAPAGDRVSGEGDRAESAPAAAVDRVIANVGRTPTSVEPLTVKVNPDGTISPSLGGNELLDYDSGEPIKLPKNSSDQEIKAAIRKAGALSNKVNFFAVKEGGGQAYTATHELREPTVNEPGQPDGGAEPIGAGSAALSSVRRRGDGQLQRRAQIIGLGIAADIQRAGSAALVGREVKDAEHLAELAQVYRDPRYETFRVFFTKGDTVIHATGVSARLPGQTPMAPAGMSDAEYVQHFKDEMGRTRADGYYILHNHPSGDPTPSTLDLQMTRRLAAEVPGMRAHVVINSNKFAVIDPSMAREGGDAGDMVTERRFGDDQLLKASKPLAAIGATVSSPDALVSIGKSMQKPGWITLVGTGSDQRVRAISEAPSSILARNDQYLAGTVRRFMRLSGARYVFAVGSNADINSRPIAKAVHAGLLVDAVPEVGDTLRQAGLPSGENPLEQTVGQHVAEGTAAYGGREAYDRAKAAGRTKLTYGQWVQVRTPGFKRWFGDWEVAAQAKVLQGQPVATLSSGDVPQSGPADVRKWAAGVFAKQGGKAANPELGDVVLDTRAVRDSMAHGKPSRFKYAAFAGVKDVLERGVVVKRNAGGMQDSFYVSAPVVVDGVDDVVTVLVHRDVNSQRMYLHSVATKESLLNRRVSGADADASERSGSSNSGDVDSVLRMLLAFKGEGASQVTDPKTGEPLVVYHGTDQSFDEFRGNAYFTPVPGDASTYSKVNTPGKEHAPNVMPVYLSINKPKVIRTYATRSDIDDARKAGFDGVIVRGVGGSKVDHFIAFRPEQIKSAIGNDGKFDAENPDIRFSLNEAASAARSTSVIGSAERDQSAAPISREDLDKVIARVGAKWVGFGIDRIVVAPDATSLPADIVDLMAREKVPLESIEGIEHGGRVYLVQSNISSELQAETVLFHEVYGHMGLRLLGAKAHSTLNTIWKDVGGYEGVAKLAKRYKFEDGTTIWQRLKPYMDMTGRMDPVEARSMIVDELVAFLAQRGESTALDRFKVYLSERKDAVVRWLYDKGLERLAGWLDRQGTEFDVLTLVRDARQAVVTGKAPDGSTVRMVRDVDGARLSRSESGGDTWTSSALAEIGALDVFKHPLSDAKSLAGVLHDVDPAIEVVGDATREDERDESGADRRTLLRADGRDVYVYERGREVWIDVSRLDPGQGGDAIYNAVANYAHNAKKEFVGDPAGLSEAAIVRRTYHMLGSALRFGETDHFSPAPEQLKGIPEKGIPPLKWHGNDEQRIQALADTFTATLYDRFPGLRDFSYDFNRHAFVDARGNVVSREELVKGGTGDVGGAAGLNRRTAAAGVFIGSLSRAPSSERPRLLASILRNPSQLEGAIRPAFSIRAGAAADAERDRGSEAGRQAGVGRNGPAGSSGSLNDDADHPRYSLKDDKTRTPEQRAALQKAGLGAAPSLKDKLHAYWGRATSINKGDVRDLADEFTQGALDQFHGIRHAVGRELGALPVDQDPYIAARLANGGTSSVMRAIMLHGQARWAANGQHLEKVPDSKGLLDILKPLGDDLEAWFGWMVGHRAARLLKEGRENLFTEADVAALKSLGKGKEERFASAAIEFTKFKRSVLDIAEQAGLIDGEGRKVWDQADWIPFYRQAEDKATFRPTGKRGLSGQTSGIRTLKGGAAGLNDPMENILMNFSRLIDASLKNNAIRKTVDTLAAGDQSVVEKIGYDFKGQVVPASQVKQVLRDAGTPDAVLQFIPAEAFQGMAKMWALQAPAEPDVVRVMRDGKPEFYRVHDGLLLKSLTSFVPFDFPGLGVMRAMRRILTHSVTATPEFMIRNFIRDSVATKMIGRDGVGAAGAIKGIAKAYLEKGGYEDLLFAGASFQSGNVNAHDPKGTAVAMRRALRERGMDAASADKFMATLVDSPAKLWERYKKIGEAIENANREAVFEAAMKAGKGVTASAYEAKDLMDFSLRGSSALYQVLADTLPFFNARVQGMYRLGRTDPKRLAIYGLGMAAASVLLALANSARPEYDELPDWDKDTYWHFWIGGAHFRLPKPFELGVVFATIPERIARYINGNDTGKKLASRVASQVWDQLAFDPVPQLFRPALNVWANKDTFRDAPIESVSDEGKLPSARYSATTSDTARVVVGAIAPVADTIGLSPKRLEYLVNGYLGTVGAYALGAADILVRSVEDRPVTPAWRLDDLPIIKSFYREDPARATLYESELYQLRTEIEQIQRTVNAKRKAEDDEGADAYAERYADKLAVRKLVNRAAHELAALNKQRDEIYADRTMTAAEKRVAVDELLRQRAEVAKEAMKDDEVAAAMK